VRRRLNLPTTGRPPARTETDVIVPSTARMVMPRSGRADLVPPAGVITICAALAGCAETGLA
jgi:hypothetical protein